MRQLEEIKTSPRIEHAQVSQPQHLQFDDEVDLDSSLIIKAEAAFSAGAQQAMTAKFQGKQEYGEVLARFTEGFSKDMIPDCSHLSIEELTEELEKSEVGVLRSALEAISSKEISGQTSFPPNNQPNKQIVFFPVRKDISPENQAIQLLQFHVTELRKVWKHDVVVNVFLRKMTLDMRASLQRFKEANRQLVSFFFFLF